MESNQPHHITHLRAAHNLQRNRAIERDELATVVKRQREQVGVGELAMVQQMGRIEDGIVLQADSVGPEMVLGVCAEGLNLCQHLRYRPRARIGGWSCS